MIRVQPQPEPPSFDAKVRAPGRRWLADKPARAAWQKLPPYWRACQPELRAAYKGICAYFGVYVAETTGASSVDHFHPKSTHLEQAYEWGNYRFASGRMNARKRARTGLLDPFEVVDGTFVLDFAFLSVHPAPDLPSPNREAVLRTRDALDLNHPTALRERQRLWDNYVQHGVSAISLYQHAPFIALEAVRQGRLRPEDRTLTAATIRAWLDAPPYSDGRS